MTRPGSPEAVIRLGVDLGGTKIEIIALDSKGGEVFRHRIPTPRGTYRGVIEAVAGLVEHACESVRAGGYSGDFTLGIGHPGAISVKTGLAMNANSVELNGQPFDRDLIERLALPIRFANDANCLAVSEAVDGAGAGSRMVFAIILGTGCGAGLAVDQQVWDGQHRIAGEMGHIPLPWPSVMEVETAPLCYCGRRGCLETWISGSGFAADFAQASGRIAQGPAIIAEAMAGKGEAKAAFERYLSRLARAIAQVITLLDPDVIVLGGGMSQIPALYDRLPDLIAPYVFSDHVKTPIRPALHGDSSGVRGAAWLWGDQSL